MLKKNISLALSLVLTSFLVAGCGRPTISDTNNEQSVKTDSSVSNNVEIIQPKNEATSIVEKLKKALSEDDIFNELTDAGFSRLIELYPDIKDFFALKANSPSFKTLANSLGFKTLKFPDDDPFTLLLLQIDHTPLGPERTALIEKGRVDFPYLFDSRASRVQLAKPCYVFGFTSPAKYYFIRCNSDGTIPPLPTK